MHKIPHTRTRLLISYMYIVQIPIIKWDIVPRKEYFIYFQMVNIFTILDKKQGLRETRKSFVYCEFVCIVA